MYGEVIDEYENRLSGVTVTLGDLVTLTDNDGVYLFENVVPGTYDMSFSKEGYETRYL